MYEILYIIHSFQKIFYYHIIHFSYFILKLKDLFDKTYKNQ